MSETLTLPDPATTADITVLALASMGVQSGVVTDYNTGSQIRTTMEAMGSVVEQQGVIAQALAFQAIIYSAYAAYGIFPRGAQPATGTVVFLTSNGTSPPPASQAVLIPSGTLLQAGNVQYVTTADALLSAGATSVTAPIIAVTTGSAGNVGPNSITVISTGLAYPLFVNNTSATSGGLDAETAIQTLQRFTSKVLSLGLASPVAIANAGIGLALPTTSETVRYATVFEGWVLQPPGSQTAGFIVYIDNGSGAASTALLAAVKALLDGNFAIQADGFRPAGVPYSVVAVSPLLSSVVVTGTLLSASLAATLGAAVTTAVGAYYDSLNFADPTQQTGIVAAVANVLAGYVTNLGVTLLDHTGAVQTSIAAGPTQRNILSNLTVTLTPS